MTAVSLSGILVKLEAEVVANRKAKSTSRSKIAILNPARVGWNDLSRILGPARARPVWQQIREMENPIRFETKAGQKARSNKGKGQAGKPTKKEVEVMAKRKRRRKKARRAKARKVAAAASNKMKMPKTWRKKTSLGMLARGPRGRIARRSATAWRRGVRAFGQPLSVAALTAPLTELTTKEGIIDLASVSAGIAAGMIGPAYLLKTIKVEPTPLTEALAGVGVGLGGSALLSVLGQPRAARLFAMTALGTLVAGLMLERLMPGAAGIGQVTTEAERVIRQEIEKALREEGLGVLTTEEVPLAGLGVLTTEEVPLEGFGDTFEDEPF